MLQHFHGKHHVEGFARLGKRLDGGGAIVDLQAAGFGVASRGGDVFLPGINPGDLGAKARQWFGQKAAAAAEIDDPQACQRLFRLAVAWPLAIGEMRTAEIAQIADANGVELVQGALRPGEIHQLSPSLVNRARSSGSTLPPP